MSLWPCRWFRRRKSSPSPPREGDVREYYVIPGTRIVADRIEEPAAATAIHTRVVEALGHMSAGPQWIRWYLVRDEFLEPPDGRMRVPFGDQTYGVHGYAIGNRIILTPHGATSLDTLKHEIRHVYGEHHDERGEWKGADE